MHIFKWTSAILLAAMLFAILTLHLVPAAFLGMLFFVLTRQLGDALTQQLQRFGFDEHRCRLTAAISMALLLTGIIVLVTMIVTNTLGNDDNLSGLALKIGDILNDMRDKLPPALVSYLPDSFMAFKQSVVNLLKQHSNELSKVGKESLHTLAHILIALAIGVILSVQTFVPLDRAKPLAFALRVRLNLLCQAFRNVVFSQIKISAINTLLTAIFLLIVLPLSGVHLPYAKTLVLLTFVVGLMPIVGNLISNTMIVVVALGVSFHLAIAALTFLVAIHKFEYFINAKIVGDRIHAAAWELLLAMLLMESIFGIAGLLMAPILYAYIKAELLTADLI